MIVLARISRIIAENDIQFQTLWIFDIRPNEDQTVPPSTLKETRNSDPKPCETSSKLTPNKNYKNLLQEYCQENKNQSLPKYEIDDIGDQHHRL